MTAYAALDAMRRMFADKDHTICEISTFDQLVQVVCQRLDPELGTVKVHEIPEIQLPCLSSVELDVTRREVALVALDQLMGRDTVFLGEDDADSSRIPRLYAREAWAYATAFFELDPAVDGPTQEPQP